jgi:uncharacterized membrane protein
MGLNPFAMADLTPSDVPAELQKKKEFQVSAAQAAQEKLDAEIPRSERMMVALGYISFLCILPLVLLQNSKFAQFHGKQALVLAIFIYFFDHLNILPNLFVSVYTILKFAVVIVSIYMSMKGQYFRIPFLAKLSERFDISIQSKS